MNNAVLKSFSASNFSPFASKVSFTTAIDSSKKEFLENTYSIGDDIINKVSFIYGANGSGKTFFCKIIREIQRLLEFSPLTAVNNAKLLSLPQFKGIDSSVSVFAFDVFFREQPTTFEIDIIIDKTTYHYEFSIKGRKIVSELLTKKYRRTEKLLERTSSMYSDIILRSELKSFEATKQVVKEEALCLPMAAFLNNHLASQIVEAIQNINVLNMTAPRVRPAQYHTSFSDERISKYVKILQKANPTIRDMTVSFEEEEMIQQKIILDDFENREIMMKKTVVEIHTKYALYDKEKEIDYTQFDFFQDESLGTIKLFTTLPHLFDVLENGGTLILDEIENGLHLSLVKDIIRLFLDKESNPFGAQLICTTHQPVLIDGDIRRDQVWVISKSTFGKSQLYRMSELNTSRPKINLANKILEGALGCNPEPFFE